MPVADARLVPRPLRVAHVALVRPGFRGDAVAAVGRSRDGLLQRAESLGVEVLVPAGGAERHERTHEPFPDGVVTDVDESRRVAAAIAELDPDVVLLQHVTFATGELVVPLVEASRRLAFWALPEPGPGRGPLPFNALCGLQMSLSLLDAPPIERSGPVRWFHGEVDEPRFLQPFARTVAALRAVRAVEGATVLRIGGTAPGFYALEAGPTALATTQVVERPLADLFETVEAVSDAEADLRAAEARVGHQVEVDDAVLWRAARIEIALERMASEASADALAVRCWPEVPDRCDAMACAAMGSLAGRGMPAACEGDLMGALSMVLLQAAAAAPAILMDLSDLDDEANALQIWHCGNAPAAWADPEGPRPRLTKHFNRTDVGPVRDETLAPGPVTALRLVDDGRAAVLAGGALLGHVREGFDGVRGWWGDTIWRDRPLSARRFMTELLEQRVPHHLAFVPGDHRAVVAEACAWLGSEVRDVVERPFIEPESDAISNGATSGATSSGVDA